MAAWMCDAFVGVTMTRGFSSEELNLRFRIENCKIEPYEELFGVELHLTWLRSLQNEGKGILENPHEGELV